MATEVKLPQLGQTMEEGTIVKCLVKVGDKVSKGDVLFEVETDKATLEMESPAAGFVKHIVADEGQTLLVGDVLMVLGAEDEQIDVSGYGKGEPAKADAEKAAPAKSETDTPAPEKEAGGGVGLPQSAKVVKLPQLGQTMEEGTIVKCLGKVGDTVAKGDVLFEVETDKATLEMESPAGGTVKKILVKEGETLLVGEAMVIIADKNVEITDAMAVTVKRGGQATEQVEQTQATAETTQFELPDSIKVVKLPQLGQTMEEGTIVSCLVKEGDKINKGDVIFEVETDKATLEMESPAGGFVKSVVAQAQDTLLVGDVVLVVGNKGDRLPEGFVGSLRSGGKTATVNKPAAAAETKQAAPPTAAKGKAPSGKMFASPRAKMAAKNNRINLALVTGTGPGGRIVEKDVLAYSESGKPAAGTEAAVEVKLGATVPLTRLQRITGEKMLQSKQQIPCFYLSTKVDVTDLVAYRTELNAKAEVKVAYNDFIMKAVAAGLEKFPVMAGQVHGDVIRLAETINIGLAIAVEDGLVAPMVKEIEKKHVTEVARSSQEIIARTKAGKLLPTDLEGGCITVSSLGAFGIESFIPIVVPGQCSILGVGAIMDTCVPENGNMLVRKLMNLTLSVDHKVANGAYAAQFLDFVKKFIEDTSNFD